MGANPDDPRIAADLGEIDALAGELIEDAERRGDRVIVVSEYGIVPVREAVHVNRALREAGYIRFAMRWAAKRSIAAHHAPSRSPTTKSRTSICSTAPTLAR